MFPLEETFGGEAPSEELAKSANTSLSTQVDDIPEFDPSDIDVPRLSRLYHAPSNVRITAQDHREKRANEIDALTRLSKHPSFRFWASEELKRLEGRQTIAQAVEEQLRPEHLEYTTF